MEMELEKMKNELASLRAEADAKAEAEAAAARQLVEMQAAIDAEEKRKNSKEYKAALRSINDLANDAEAQKQSIHKAVDALMAEIETWADIVKKRKDLGRENRIEASDLVMVEISKIGNVYSLKKHIEKWKNEISLRAAYNEMYKPGKPDPEIKRDSDWKQMMEKRYPKT